MAWSWARALSLFALSVSSAFGQFPPRPENVTVVNSRFHAGIEISYREAGELLSNRLSSKPCCWKTDSNSFTGVCETTPGVKSYSGYVHLPSSALNETEEDQFYPINTFFWFFESRKDPGHAPLAIWLNGGPGGSSLYGALVENGPCFVANDSNSTYLNPWSWNNEVNMLYIDQPNQVGYSYDTLTNITGSLQKDGFFGVDIQPADFSDGVPEQNLTFMVGTSGSQDFRRTANSTTHAATAIWHFAQTWFEEFPHYKPEDEQISIFTESYGGHYGPAFVSFFMKQNGLIANGTIADPGAHILHINTLGIVNGLIDAEAQMSTWATFANNNTYDIKAFTDAEYDHAMHELTRPGGIKDSIRECHRLQRELDPDDHGNVEEVNKACIKAGNVTDSATIEVYLNSQKTGWFDITHPGRDPFPSPYAAGFLNQHWVQKALGVPVNHTFASSAVGGAFGSTGDTVKGGLLEDVAYILDHGVRVAMIYGDRDYACNWVGGESASIKVPYSHHVDFTRAGYAPVVLDPFRSAGLTRQYGNFSFTRVYQAGHMVPAYQPEASYEIFMRAIRGRDIATGTVDLRAAAASGEEYSSHGTRDAW